MTFADLSTVGKVLLILLDLSAASDTVNRGLLLSRLSTCYRLCGSVVNWFTSYLTNRTQFVDINGTFSTIRHLGVGLPQGSVLGPLLYLLYTSPVADIVIFSSGFENIRSFRSRERRCENTFV